jgi:osmotically inducible protein OsmC
MPRIVRDATVAWAGSLSRGAGTATAGTGSFELPVDLPARVGDPGAKTSPEELLAPAHAACYTMSIAGEVARAGGTVERLETRCTIIMDEVEGQGHLIVGSELDVTAGATGIDDETFRRVAEVADQGCSFSALLRASATVTVRATLDS